MTTPPGHAIRCPFCDGIKSQVVDSHNGTVEFGSRRRRRLCTDCSGRFTTYEISEENVARLMEHGAKAFRDQAILSARDHLEFLNEALIPAAPVILQADDDLPE